MKKRLKKRWIDPLYNTLVGSAICTIAITTGKDKKEARKLFLYMKQHKNNLQLNTVEEIMDYIWGRMGSADKKIRSSYVLVTDKYNIKQPMVTFVNDEGNIMPIDPEGFKTINILYLAQEGKDYIEVEFIYNEEGEIYSE